MRRSLAPSALTDCKRRPQIKLQNFIPENRIPSAEMVNNYSSASSCESYQDLINSILSRPFKSPASGHHEVDQRKSLGMRRCAYHIRALHDPFADNALVLYEPPQVGACEKLTLKREDQLVHVVVDPMLCKVLRPHQREGVKFMYDCVMGQKVENNYGCIMADDMGLGKTLQCITIMWTLMRQSPTGRPAIQKAVIACPASLVRNWSKELQKWLGGRVPTMAIDGTGAGTSESQICSFASSCSTAGYVLVVSYETLRQHYQVIAKGNVGMLICDEGHRLKNQENLVYKALNSIPATKRILISGTPIQNDLLEYFSLIQFVNAGLLGSASQFRRNFETPILRGRDSLASDEEKRISEQKLNELVNIVNVCVIRRTASILSQYLPIKVEQLLCIKLTDLQLELYRKIIENPSVARTVEAESNINSDEAEDGVIVIDDDDDDDENPSSDKKTDPPGANFTGSGCSSLQVITLLKKLCNHPELLLQHAQHEMQKDGESKDEIISSIYPTLLSHLRGSSVTQNSSVSRHKNNQPSRGNFAPELSGKFKILDCLLAMVRTRTTDRFVLISNYTQTLDLFESLCKMRKYTFTRLDGSVPIKKRQVLVDKFNSPDSDIFIFMLSSKAGGCGLNLIGGNRLVMFDPDWNPANDSQAMARVWREGQRKQVFVYRFVSLGTLEETMVQRQIQKQALSSCVVDEMINTERHFNRSELKNLFNLDLKPNTISCIHTNLRCQRCMNDRQIARPPEDATCNSSLSAWNHISSVCSKELMDDMLKGVWQAGMTFVFYQTSHKKQLGEEKRITVQNQENVSPSNGTVEDEEKDEEE